MGKENPGLDQGYAWIVLFASFAIEVIGGILFGCVGLITTAILEEVEDNLTSASLVSSTMLGTFTLFGPLAGVIQDKIGHRLTGVISGVVMLIGLIAASFCRTVPGLVLTFGLITGLGLGLAINLSGVAPGKYFDKKLPVAYGVCVSGAGVGLFVTGPLTVFLLELYKLPGTLLLLGGIAFHVCLAGALIRPRTEADRVKDVAANERVVSGVRSTSDDGTRVQGSEGNASVSTESGTLRNSLEKDDTLTVRVDRDVESTTGDEACVQGTGTNNPALTERGTLRNNQVVKSLLNWLFILKTNGFFLYVISILFCSTGESACMVHLPNYVEHKGSTAEQSASILTGMGATNMLSGILTGFAASDRSVPKLLLHTGFLGLSGILTLLFPLYCYSYPLQMVYGALYGLYGQGAYSLLGPLCIELAGVANLATAYGLSCFFLGVGYLIGPPIASLLYEMSGIYDSTFIFAGCSMVASAFSAAFIPMLRQK